MRSTLRYLPILLPLLILLPFIIISYYNHPALDDWWYAEVYMDHGVAGAQQYWYNNYTARYFSNFIMTLAPLSFGWIEGHKIMPVIFIICLFATFYFICHTFFQSTGSRKIVLPLWITAAYLLVQRDYFESLYWLSANIVYQFAMISFLLHLAFIGKIFLFRQYSWSNIINLLL